MNANSTKLAPLMKLRKDKEEKEKQIGFVAKQFGANPASQEVLQRLDPDVMVDSPLTTTQFLILHENARKRQALQEAKAEQNKLRENNLKLQEQRQSDRAESYEVVEFLHKDNRQKQKQIDDLEARLRAAQAAAKGDLDDAERKFRDERKTLREQYERLADELRDRITHLENELLAVRDYKQRRDAVEHELKRLREEAEDLRRENDKFGTHLERKYVEQNHRMRQEFEHRLEGTVAEAQTALEQSMDAQVRGVVLANKKLTADIKIYAATHDELKRQKAEVERELQRVRLDLEIREGSQQELSTRAAMQARELREAQQRMKRLEMSMAELATAIDHERTTMQQTLEDYRRQATQQINRLSDALRHKEGELLKMKRLAKDILHQRNDTEVFLLTSLQEVREEMAQEALAEAGRLSRQPTNNSIDPASLAPSTSVMPSVASMPGVEQKKVDIKDLSWAEREKVLRVLFRKINEASQGAPPGNPSRVNRAKGGTTFTLKSVDEEDGDGGGDGGGEQMQQYGQYGGADG